MAALPVGTVTLFYSEVENSTRLLQYLNARYPAVLEELRAILRAAISNHGGHEVAAFGDGLFVVFSRAADGEPGPALSRRERQVASLIARGYSTREISEELVIGVRTVEAHVMAIFNKLGVSSRAQIAVWAVDHGLRHTPPALPIDPATAMW